MKNFGLAAIAVASTMSITACLNGGQGYDESDKYTINVVTTAEVAIGKNEMTRTVNRNTLPGEAERIIARNPGLDEALRRNRVDVSRVATIRVRPDNVVDVFLKS